MYGEGWHYHCHKNLKTPFETEGTRFTYFLEKTIKMLFKEWFCASPKFLLYLLEVFCFLYLYAYIYIYTIFFLFKYKQEDIYVHLMSIPWSTWPNRWYMGRYIWCRLEKFVRSPEKWHPKFISRLFSTSIIPNRNNFHNAGLLFFD